MEIFLPAAGAIRQSCHTREFYRILETWQCGAVDGGCLMVAAALRQLYGGNLAGLWGYQPKTEPRLQHVVLQIDNNCFVDGDGISTYMRLARRWRRWEGVIVTAVQPLDEIRRAVARGIPYDRLTIARLEAYFARQLQQPTNFTSRTGESCII